MACGGGYARVGAAAAVDEVKRSIALGMDSNSALIVDWPAKSRRDLELALERGVVAVAVSGDQFVFIEGCFPGQRYRYQGFAVSQESARTQNKGRESADLPFGGAIFGTAAEQGGSASVEVYSVGRYIGPNTAFKGTHLQGQCRTATHVVATAEVGAFVLVSGGSDATTDGVDLTAVSATSRRESNSASTARSGDPRACDGASKKDAAPPDRCSSPHTVQLVPIDDEGIGLRAKTAKWTGNYDCAFMPWTIELATAANGSGALEGDVRVASGSVSGKWHLKGSYSAANRTFTLNPVEPIDVPAGWSPVGYTGTATPGGRRLLGNTSDCGDFVFDLEPESTAPYSSESESQPGVRPDSFGSFSLGAVDLASGGGAGD